MMTMKETKFIRALIALLLADIPKNYMKVFFINKLMQTSHLDGFANISLIPKQKILSFH